MTKNTTKKAALLLAVIIAFCGCTNTQKAAEETTMQTILTTQSAPQQDLTWQQQVQNHIDENSGDMSSGGRLGGLNTGDTVRNWYEVFVNSFNDSDGDGVGDLNGVTEMLDYISYMGFNGIWLMPIHPSPTYHKYDVTDYFGIHESYGTMEDFDRLIAECDKRNIDVILDLVLNHTSSEHEWFTTAKKALREGDLDNPYIDYYHFSKEKGNGQWQTAAGEWYYECQFTGGMPDLNLDSEKLRDEIEKVMKFWLDKGVDGFRLDAVIEYETGNRAKNIEILEWINTTAKKIKPDAYIVGEAWESSLGLYDYYSSGVDSFFDFNYAMADGKLAKYLLLKNQSAEDYISQQILTQQSIKSHNPSAENASFFTNHDTARAAGILRQDARLIKMAWGMNLFQSGNAFVYYGEEIGMSGSGVDPDKRLPMYWTENSRDKGIPFAPPGSTLTSDVHKFDSVLDQLADENSIINFVRSALHLRAKYPAIAQGEIETDTDCKILSEGNKLAVCKKTYADTTLTLVYNLGDTSGKLQLANGMTVQDGLYTGEDKAVQTDNVLEVPAYSILVIK